MPLYEYVCPEGPHTFEKIVPVEDFEKSQECPEHHKECTRVEFSQTAPFVWGVNEIHWSAGTSSNPLGMNHAKKPNKPKKR